VRCHRRPFSHYVQWILRLARNLRVSCSATASLPNVEIHVGAEIASLAGDRVGGLTGVTFRNRVDGSERHCPLRHLFLFIGADPDAAWLTGCVETDEKGFIMTGKSVLTLETSQPGVFAIGDVRADSTKRVAAAVGEGAAVVAQIHALIAARSARREA
jgi:thioredoxin reductase (NADPH)